MQKKKYYEKLFHIVNFIILFLISLSSIVIIIELSLSYTLSPCSGWLTTCLFKEINNVCGYYSNISFNNYTGKYRFLQKPETCYGVWSISGYSLLVCLIILYYEIKSYTGKNSLTLTYMVGQSLGALINVFCFLYMVMIIQGGYSYLCDQLNIPLCNNSKEFVPLLNKCTLGFVKLPLCSDVSNTESFIGRLRVTAGLAWVGFIASLFSIVCIIVTFNPKFTMMENKESLNDGEASQRFYQHSDYVYNNETEI